MTGFHDGSFNQTGTGFGLNSSASTVEGDDTDEFDENEGFTFSFDTTVLLQNVTVSSFGGSSAGAISFDGGSTIASITATGMTSLSDTQVLQGTVLRFTSTGSGSTDQFSLDSLTVSAVPEPSTYATLGGLAILGFAATQRRRRNQRNALPA